MGGGGGGGGRDNLHTPGSCTDVAPSRIVYTGCTGNLAHRLGGTRQDVSCGSLVLELYHSVCPHFSWTICSSRVTQRQLGGSTIRTIPAPSTAGGTAIVHFGSLGRLCGQPLSRQLSEKTSLKTLSHCHSSLNCSACAGPTGSGTWNNHQPLLLSLMSYMQVL